MENAIRIESVTWYERIAEEQRAQLLQTLRSEDRGAVILLPDPADSNLYWGVLLTKYYTSELSACAGVRETKMEDGFCKLIMSAIAVRIFINSLLRRIRSAGSARDSSKMENLMAAADSTPKEPQRGVVCMENALTFLQSWSPARIQQKLDEYVIGQPELTRAVADFLYYHALRQLHPDLPQRPLLISGPSGSGKTEVWRVVRQLYGHLFHVRIMDGSSLSCEGWSGNYKLNTYIDASMVNGGILVVDEFDKLTKPRHSSRGDNVSLDIQSEFLKLMEGEYCVTEQRKQTNMTSRKMGFVMVGAFESLRAEKQGHQLRQQKSIGFCTQQATLPVGEELTDDDFIAYGILPEIVGRIAVKCMSHPLPDSAYLDILHGPHSRVTQLTQVLGTYGIGVSDVISKEALLELVSSSKSNHTGVRWVSAQVESRLLEAIYDQGLFQPQAAAS